MGKNLTPKIVLIIVLVVIAVWTLYPPDKTLKPGIDLAGGTSLIYEIDTQGLKDNEKIGLAQRMITVLRRRIDPVNIQNLVWRPQGSTRFEIQMPLASAEARGKRQNFEKAKSALLAENISPAEIMRSLEKPAEERAADFNDFTQRDPNRLTILETLAKAYDERKELQNKRDELNTELETAEKEMASVSIDPNEVKLNVGSWSKLNAELETAEKEMASAGIDTNEVKLNVGSWSKLDEKELAESLKEFADANEHVELLGKYVNREKELAESLKEFADANEHVELLGKYVKKYSEWAEVVNQLTDAEFVEKYEKAKTALDKLNLTEDQIDFCLEMSAKSKGRQLEIKRLKIEFADRVEKIESVVSAFDEYRPFQGRLDDPKDLQRMLKGAGILEFRILPTTDQPELDADEITRQVDLLKTKGPKFASAASKGKYVWCEIESIKDWNVSNSIGGQFGEKYFVLASNTKDETMLHSIGEQRAWKLERSKPSTDDMGRRAIGFSLNEKGGLLFGKLTGNNIDRPLCILLDGIAISAPNIKSRIGRQGQITGSFGQTEVADMVDKLNAGSLPARLIEQPISVKTIGPSIGADNRKKGIRAGLIGLCLVVLCMLAYYTLAGSIADTALLMNILFVLAIMALIRATFTLPGIAGIILTIGMSVDANVLIFERIREEQKRGSSLRIAVRNGYQRAFRTIFDANLTTFITAAILFWVASEEIKGFALVLMLGIASSMFTALFVTRVVFEFLLSRRIIKEHLIMLNLIGTPNVNWMASRPIFLGISSVLIAAGLFVFLTRDDAKNNKYDIEFTGGTAAVLNLKDGVELTRQQVEDKIHDMGTSLDNAALAAANVYSIGKSGRQYEINTTETNKTSTTITFPESAQHTVKSITSAIREAEGEFGGRLNKLLVTKHSSPVVFLVTTSQMNKSLVKNVLTTAFADANVFADANIGEPQVDEVVNDAILKAFEDELEIQLNLGPKIISQEKITEELVDSQPELAEFLGGIKIICEIERAATAEEINSRLADLQYKPDMQDLNRYPHKILSADAAAMEPNRPASSFMYLSVEPEAGFRELTEDEWTRFVENERTKVLAATRLETSLPRVTQIDPSVGAEAKTRALIAIVLSLFAIVTYIWIRFGDVRYGLAAIAALVHDVCITLGAITACTYIASTTIGEKLLIGDFKINLGIIAALLTIIGYSLNDTIVVFDRIRENRRKGRLNPQIITNSINQTISRTILTSFTTFIVVLIMYIFGGQGLRGFTFAIGLGIIVGTYSSIAVAAPILLLGTKPGSEKGRKNKKA